MKLFFSFIFVSGIFAISCNSGYTQEVSDEYLITDSKLDSLLSNNDSNIIVFYTSWCNGSKETIENFYFEVQDSINSKGLNNRIILLLADERVDTGLINEQRRKGFMSYCIGDAGTSAMENRSAIKKYINEKFRGKEINWLVVGFKIPVELLISNNKNIINVSDEFLPFKYSAERILGLKIGKVEPNLNK